MEVLEGNHGLQKRSPPLSKELDEKVAKLTFVHSVRALNVPTQGQADFSGVKVEAVLALSAALNVPLRDKQIFQVSRLKAFSRVVTTIIEL